MAAVQSNKVYIVTGSNAGIGKEIVRGIAKQGHHVVMAARSESKGQQALDELVSSGISKDNLRLMLVDLSSQESITKFATSFKSNYNRLDGLVNNAGIAGNEQKTLTSEGFEEVLASNIISYFLLTHLLQDTLIQTAQQTKDVRVVNVASHYAGGLDVNDLGWDKRSYDNNSAYKQSKQANRMLSWEFAKRFQGKGVSVNACHPGVIDTKLLQGLGYGSSRTPSEGADTPTWLATSAQAKGVTNKFFDLRKEVQCNFRNEKQNAQLWNKMLELTKLPDILL